MSVNIKSGGDTAAIANRCLLLSIRNPDTFFASILLPILMMLLFTALFGNLIHIGETSYTDYMIPGILLQCIGQGTSVTAVMMNKDMTNGVVNRLCTLPIRRLSILNGHILEALARSGVTSAAVLFAAAFLGVRPSLALPDLCVVLLLLFASSLALSYLAVLTGILASSAEGASALSALVIVLPYLSSGFVPTEALPKALRAFAEHQPLTPIIDTMRSALSGSPIETESFLCALAWCLGLTAVFSFAALRALNQKV